MTDAPCRGQAALTTVAAWRELTRDDAESGELAELFRHPDAPGAHVCTHARLLVAGCTCHGSQTSATSVSKREQA